MPLADHSPAPTHTGKPCSIGALLAELDEADRATLTDWIGRYTDATVFESLRKAGHVVSLQQIGRHRRGICQCHG